MTTIPLQTMCLYAVALQMLSTDTLTRSVTHHIELCYVYIL